MELKPKRHSKALSGLELMVRSKPHFEKRVSEGGECGRSPATP